MTSRHLSVDIREKSCFNIPKIYILKTDMESIHRKSVSIRSNPATGFIAYFITIALAVFVPLSGRATPALYLIILCLLVVSIFLNVNFITWIFRGISISKDIRRNHALEQGTLHFLRCYYRGSVKVSGSVRPNGFYVYGAKRQEDINKAFKRLLIELKKGKLEGIIADTCGTDMATAQGLGILLLTLSALFTIFFKADIITAGIVLGLNILFYLLLRRRLAQFIRNMLFVSLDFGTAQIRSIDRMEDMTRSYFKHNPVWFVKTSMS